MSVSVVLTGATGGIGRAIARAFVERGDRIVLVSRSAEGLGRLARELSHDAAPGAVEALAVDVTTEQGRTAIVSRARARACDVLINDAAIPSFGPLESLDDAHVEAVIATDLVAPILLTRAMLPVLRQRSRATVLNIGSAAGRLGLPGFSVYGAAKFGLRGFSEALRRELADGPVRVRHLAPRATRTAFNDARVEAYNRATGARLDAPERVAAAAIAMVDGGAAERTLGFPEALAVRLNGLMPTLLDGAFRAHRAALRALPRRPETAGSSQTMELPE
jgi:short-subunit dehydrogenase